MASPDYNEAAFTESRRRKSAASSFRPIVFFLVPLFSVLLDIFLPRFIESARTLEFPLLITIYFSLMKRQPIAGIAIGAVIGLMQDSLSQQPLGMFGIVKTLVGYFAASVSLRFDVNNHLLRFLLCVFFFVFHQFLYLGQVPNINAMDEFVRALLNSAVALPLFMLLDKLRESEA